MSSSLWAKTGAVRGLKAFGQWIEVSRWERSSGMLEGFATVALRVNAQIARGAKCFTADSNSANCSELAGSDYCSHCCRSPKYSNSNYCRTSSLPIQTRSLNQTNLNQTNLNQTNLSQSRKSCCRSNFGLGPGCRLSRRPNPVQTNFLPIQTTNPFQNSIRRSGHSLFHSPAAAKRRHFAHRPESRPFADRNKTPTASNRPAR